MEIFLEKYYLPKLNEEQEESLSRPITADEIEASKLKVMEALLKKKFFCCYSITVVCIFSPSLHPIPAEPTSLP